MPVELLCDARAALGEGPAWDAAAGVLHWVDIPAGRLHRFDPASGEDEYLELGEPIGCAAPARAGGLVAALRSGFYHLHPPETGRTLLARPPHVRGTRFNDGKCDPAGRFLAGTMDEAEQAANGCLYACEPGEGSLRLLLAGLRISNGLTWSPDYKTFYFIDTPTRLVCAYEYDLSSGAIANPRPVVRIPPGMGYPDGMTSDMDGGLWIALWGGGRVTRWDAHTGELTAEYALPASQVTSCIFGGEDLGDLYITTARRGLDAAERTRQPLAGGLFRLRTGLSGMPTFEFAGAME